MEEIKEDDLEELKKKLRFYRKENIKFNEPHFTNQLILREGDRKEVLRHILNPDNLVYSYQEKNKYGTIRHCLHFKISNSRTMRLPVFFEKGNLYILTYIMRYRPWQNMIKTKGRKLK